MLELATLPRLHGSLTGLTCELLSTSPTPRKLVSVGLGWGLVIHILSSSRGDLDTIRVLYPRVKEMGNCPSGIRWEGLKQQCDMIRCAWQQRRGWCPVRGGQSQGDRSKQHGLGETGCLQQRHGGRLEMRAQSVRIPSPSFPVARIHVHLTSLCNSRTWSSMGRCYSVRVKGARDQNEVVHGAWTELT